MSILTNEPDKNQAMALLLAKSKLVVFGFVTILAIVLTMVGLWISSVSQNTDRLKDVVERQTQTRLLATMLYAIQQRSLILHQMSDLVDPFEQDDKYLEFKRFGTLYLTQREKLLATGLSDSEKSTLRDIDELAHYGGNMQDHVANLILQGLIREAKTQLDSDVAENQSRLVDKLRSIFESQRNYVDSQLHFATDDQQQTYWFILFFTSLALILGIYTGLVLRRTFKSEMRSHKQSEWIRSLYQISSSPQLSTDEQIIETLNLGRQLLGMDEARVYRCNLDDNTISTIHIVSEKSENNISANEIPLEKSFCKFAINTNTPICIPDTQNTDLEINDCFEASQAESWIGIPLYVNQQKFGIISFYNSNARKNLSQDDINLSKLIANWISVTKEKQIAQQNSIARETAEIANQTKSIFLANMSHELRTPLHAILGYNELLKDDIIAKGHHEHLKDIDKIDAAGKHLLSLINDVLDLSKIEAGKMEVNCETFSLKMLLEEIQATVAPLVSLNRNEIVVLMDDELDTVSLDLIKARQILLNLIGNAAKFTSNGLIKLIITTSCNNSKNLLQFIIKDSGIGMTPDQLDKLFVAFSQVGPHTQKNFGGTGLGLAITHRLCQIMDGSISVESLPDVGTTFTVQLPYITRQSAESNSKAATG